MRNDVRATRDEQRGATLFGLWVGRTPVVQVVPNKFGGEENCKDAIMCFKMLRKAGASVTAMNEIKASAEFMKALHQAD